MESNPKYYDPVEVVWQERLAQQDERNFLRRTNWWCRKADHWVATYLLGDKK